MLDQDVDAEDPPPIAVIDNGANEVRCGWAGDDGPAECLPGGTKIAALLEALEVEEPSEQLGGIVLSERLGASASQREATAAALFKLGVPRVYISTAPLLTLYHLGADTGIVVDIGEHCTCIFPMYEGFPILDAATRVDLGGASLDGREACDGLFEAPDSYPGDAPFVGVHEAILRTVRLCDVSVRRALLGQVLCVGGATLLPGFVERLTRELDDALSSSASAGGSRRGGGGKGKGGRGAAAAPQSAVKVIAKGDRRIACWLGGATFGATATGKAELITKEMFESDPSVLHRPYNTLAVRTIDEQEAYAAAARASGGGAAARQRRPDSLIADGRTFWLGMAASGSIEEKRRMRHTQQSFVLPLYEQSAERHLITTGVQEGASLAAIAGVASIAALFTTTDEPVMVAEEGEALLRRVRQRLQARWAWPLGESTHNDAFVSCHPAIARLRCGRLFGEWTLLRNIRRTASTRADAAYEHWANSQFPRGFRLWSKSWLSSCETQIANESADNHYEVILRMTLRASLIGWGGSAKESRQFSMVKRAAAARSDDTALRKGMKAIRECTVGDAGWNEVVAANTATLKCWIYRRRWVAWYAGHMRLLRLLKRAQRLFGGFRLFAAIRSQLLRRQRKWLQHILAIAHDRARTLEHTKKGWREWREMLQAVTSARAARTAAVERGALTSATNKWRRWREKRMYSSHAAIVAADRHKKRAWLFFKARGRELLERARAGRVARGACRKWQQRYGLRNWSRESEILRRKLARLHRCTMDFAVVSSLLKMGIGFRAIKSEWVTVKRALKAKTKYEQTIIADAQIRRHRHRHGWRRWREAVNNSMYLLRLQRLGLRILVKRRAKAKLDSLHKWARSPQMIEFRRWRHQERVLQKVNDMLASSPTSQLTPVAASALSQVLDSHRTSLHVMRRLVATWPNEPLSHDEDENDSGGSSSPHATGSARKALLSTTSRSTPKLGRYSDVAAEMWGEIEKSAISKAAIVSTSGTQQQGKQRGTSDYSPRIRIPATPPPSQPSPEPSSPTGADPRHSYVPGSGPVINHLGVRGAPSPPPANQPTTTPATRLPPPSSFAPPSSLVKAESPSASPPTRRVAAAMARFEQTARAAREQQESSEQDRASTWLKAATARGSAPRSSTTMRHSQSAAAVHQHSWGAVADGSFFSQVRQDLEDTSGQVPTMAARRAAFQSDRGRTVAHNSSPPQQRNAGGQVPIGSETQMPQSIGVMWPPLSSL